ncbi:MAG: hypothetical protein HY244_15150, partial [Rhizobiales bacterium]|nr:hypothetical protein [Hyphomicrobiales bacterium]
ERIERPAGFDRRARRQRLMDSLQLSNDRTQPNDDKAANGSRATSNDQCVPEAELMDGKAKSDHGGAYHKGNDTNAIQHAQHERYALCYAANSPFATSLPAKPF